jgi:tRNA pseudouridine38-40 synthase
VPRYKLTVAYDGTDFCGWQKQEPMPGGSVGAEKVLGEGEAGRLKLRTVQEVLERAVREVVREPVTLMGASRTDAGVHARGQVASFSCSEPPAKEGNEPESAAGDGTRGSGWPLSRGADRLVLAINSRLPEDVLVIEAEPVEPAFNPIRDCTGKGYSYALFVCPTRALFERRYVHHLWTPLNVDLMREAARRLEGEHDFAAFAAAGHGRLTTVRTVFECRVEEEPAGPLRGWESGARQVRINVSGSGFLYNMVRIIAGTLVEVGRGRMTPADVSAAIESRDRRRAGPTLPPRGLCLEWVSYAAGRTGEADTDGAPAEG